MRPILFTLPFLDRPVYAYGFMLGLSFVCGWYVVAFFCERDGVGRARMGWLYVGTAVSAIVGSRVLFVATNLSAIDGIGEAVAIWKGGIVAYGGFLGGFLFSFAACRAWKSSLLGWADCVMPALGLGLSLTRTGCFLAGCDFGRPAPDLPWAVTFPMGSPAWTEQLNAGLIAGSQPRSLSVHPTQLYEVAIGLFLFGVVLLVRRYRTFAGQSFVAFTVGYGILRFLVEGLRADSQRGAIGPFSTSQIIGLVTAAAAIALYFFLLARERADPGSSRPWERAGMR